MTGYCITALYKNISFLDEPDNSEVHAFWEDDGTMTATIKTDSDVYYIEVGLVLFEHLTASPIVVILGKIYC